MDYATSYLAKQSDSISKWDTFIAELKYNFKPLAYNPNFPIPIELLRQAAWTPDEVEHFFYLFMQFNCEALVIFEQSLMYAYVQLQDSLPTNIENQAFAHFVREEFYHTKAFRQYLRSEPKLQFPQNSLVLHRCHRLKNAFAWVLKMEPLAIIIPGAKSETYSLFFSKMLERTFGKDGNSLTKLNTIHSVDEFQHVALDYPLLESALARRSLWSTIRFIFYTFTNIVLIQFIVLLGMANLLHQIRPNDSRWQRFNLMIKIFKWVLWNFAPYQQTRRSLRATYSQKKHFMYRIFSIGAT